MFLVVFRMAYKSGPSYVSSDLYYRSVIFCVEWSTVYPKKYAHGFCVAVLCCGYTLTDFPISIRLTSLALWQSNDCPSASKATLMNMDKYFIWIHYEWLHNHNKAKHNKTVCIFLGIYNIGPPCCVEWWSMSSHGGGPISIYQGYLRTSKYQYGDAWICSDPIMSSATIRYKDAVLPV